VPNESAAHVIATATPTSVTTNDGTRGRRYVGPDQNGQVLEVITIDVPGDVLVIHVMPYIYRTPRSQR
jgi:hypothetical protein